MVNFIQVIFIIAASATAATTAIIINYYYNVIITDRTYMDYSDFFLTRSGTFMYNFITV